jgi:Na+/phosphate symporter
MSTTLPRITAEELKTGILEMCGSATEMLRLTRDAFVQDVPTTLDRVAALGHDLHLKEKRLTDHVATQLQDRPWSLGSAEQLALVPMALERIGDSVDALARRIARIHRDGVPFTDRAFMKVNELFNRAADLMGLIATAVRTDDRSALARVREDGAAFAVQCEEATLRHQERILNGTCAPRASSIFLAMLDHFRDVERYVQRIAAAVEKAFPAP